jgi:ABC-type multidrug transport system ATPase subunit
MLYDEPTSGLDPLTATQVLDLVLRARDLHGVSSLLVTKRLDQIEYLVTRRAEDDCKGGAVINAAGENEQGRTKVMLLDGGRIAFFGSYAEFAASALPAVGHLLRPDPGRPHEIRARPVGQKAESAGAILTPGGEDDESV